MTQYTYQIHIYGSCGEIYDEQGKWYNNIQYCEENLIKRLNGQKFIEEMNDNDVNYSCFVDVYIITNENLNNIDSEKYSTIYFQDKYQIIKYMEKLKYEPGDGFYKKINSADLVILN